MRRLQVMLVSLVLFTLPMLTECSRGGSNSARPQTSTADAQATPQPSAQPAPPPPTVPGAQSKAIFEPVNYGQDINLTDVFFVTPEAGWVAGEHGTILKTTDSGTTWVAQSGGDANNNEARIGQLRFLDQTHGWAVQDGPALLRTVDGQHWEHVDGKFPAGTPVVDYAFTSVGHGILAGGNGDAFYVTDDGGRQWQQVAPCQLKVTVQGLAHNEGCQFVKLQMLSPRSGYATVRWRSPEAPNDESVAFFRTDDAGIHWAAITPELRDCCDADATFTDLQHGVVVFNNGKTYLTADGARTWHALVSGGVGLTKSGPAPAVRFADAEVGWSLGPSPDNSDTFRVSFSTDGGQHWEMSRNITFPVTPRTGDLKFAFPRRDRAYVIGPHGMIYRYSIVPASYTAAKAVEGPLMPAFSEVGRQNRSPGPR